MKDALKTKSVWSLCWFTLLAMSVQRELPAQNLPAPVSGLLILDLAGTPIPDDDVIQSYTAGFVAASSNSTITFTFRHDPGFFFLSDVSVTTGGGPDLIVNGDFMTNAPTDPGAGLPDWTYFVQDGYPSDYLVYLGFEDGFGDFDDGAVQAYDGIDQTFPTVPGNTYVVSFDLFQEGAYDTDYYQQVSNNGDTTDTEGNGIDVVVYAGDGLPTTSSLPIAITVAATNVTADAAALNGMVNPDGQTTTAYFQWGISTNYGNVFPTPAITCDAGSNIITIPGQELTGLSPNTVYHFRLVATNSMGVGYGDDEMFTTATASEAQPQMGIPQFASRLAQFSITGADGETCVIEASTNLFSWVAIYTNMGPFTFMDLKAGNFAARFYRAVTPAGPPTQPQLNSLQLLNAAMATAVTGMSGQTYIVEASTNLVNWVPICTNSGSFRFADPGATGYGWRFYRARIP